MIVSHSEVEAYLLCTRRHWYAFGEKLQKKTVSDSLRRGITGHDLLATVFRAIMSGASWTEALQALDRSNAANFIIAMETSPDPAKTAKELAHLQRLIFGFLEYYKDKILAWEIHGVERKFQIQLTEDITYAFTVDVLIWEDGKYAPVDWKFSYDFYTKRAMRLLPQVPKYMGGLQFLGAPVTKGYYGFIRYRSLKAPVPEDLYKITSMEPNDYRIKQTFNEWMGAAREIAVLKQGDPINWLNGVRRVGNQLVCRSCSFADLCGTELQGSEGTLMRQEQYEPSTYGYVEVTE